LRTYESTPKIAAVTATIAIAIIAIWIIMSRRKKTANENDPRKAASTAVE
jgi:hypothetical protein